MTLQILTLFVLSFAALYSENTQENSPMNQEKLPCFSSAARSIKIGSVYEHYKGLRYTILAVARHSETLEELTIYQASYGDRDVWVRPLEMFLEHITVNGKLQPRFSLVEQ